MSQKFDVIVIGAGVAGLGAAALLARDFKQRVLVLERAPFIGGRTLSYVGKGNKVTADGIEMDARAFRKSLAYAHCYLGKCTPSIEEIFERGLLDGRTFEAGGHGLFWGNKSRVDCLMKHLGVQWNLPLNRGLGFVEWEGEGKSGKAYQVGKNEPYQWMSKEGFAATMAQLRDMGTATFTDMAKLMKTPLQTWLEQRGLHPEAYDYIKVLAASQTAMAEPMMTPTGDFLGYMAIAGQIGMNLIKGSVATADEPGTIAIPQAFERVVEAHGGVVMRNTRAKEVIIENGRVTGVRIHSHDNEYDQDRVILADRVICTIPPKYMFRVLPRQHFPSDWVQLLEHKFWGAGLLTGWCGLKRSVMPDIGLEEGSFVYMPGVIRDEGYIGAVDMVMCDFSAWGGGQARRAPEGKREFYFSTALTDEEMRNPDRVNRVINLCEDWARTTFPTWDQDCEFILWTPSPEAYGLWRPVGVDRPDVRSPHVEGLFFAGDQYGKRLWGGGVDGASLSAVLCVDAMQGTNLETTIMPAWHQGIPEVA
ncbi:MAG TPA: FAD-dependent oxidoreductase [Steroidobacter sp.]|uniref:phytoene desaturase family protein n=1 Tax=Steroidobacter sp. TaxID=1978227 RepID=UPI002EDAA911